MELFILMYVCCICIVNISILWMHIVVIQSKRTALWWASYSGHVELVKLLLESNADINLYDKVNNLFYIIYIYTGIFVLFT